MCWSKYPDVIGDSLQTGQKWQVQGRHQDNSTADDLKHCIDSLCRCIERILSWSQQLASVLDFRWIVLHLYWTTERFALVVFLCIL